MQTTTIHDGRITYDQRVWDSPTARQMWELHLLLRRGVRLSATILDAHTPGCRCRACKIGLVASLRQDIAGVHWTAEAGAGALRAELVPPSDLADAWSAESLAHAKWLRDGTEVPTAAGG